MLADVSVDDDGLVYVLDSIKDPVVQVFDQRGRVVRSFGQHGDKEAQFHFPVGMEVDHEGRAWIVDAFGHGLKVYDKLGEFMVAFGGFGTGGGRFSFPSDVAVSSDTVYVLESAGHRVQAFSILRQ